MRKEKAAPVAAPMAPFLRASETILARSWLFKFLKSSTTDVEAGPEGTGVSV